MTRDVVLAKCESIERGGRRARKVYAFVPAHLTEDLDKQDSIVLNLQRACESSIDLAMHLIASLRLGVPQESREAFALLVRGGGLPAGLGESLQRMVGFRNIAMHEYRALDLEIVRDIVERRSEELLAFAKWALALQ